MSVAEESKIIPTRYCTCCSQRFGPKPLSRFSVMYVRQRDGREVLNAKCDDCLAKDAERRVRREYRRVSNGFRKDAGLLKRQKTAVWSKWQQLLSRSLTGKCCSAWMVTELGYDAEALRVHLERQFSSGMGWENYAGSVGPTVARKWNVDHIIPKTDYALGDVKAAYSLSNLRPLWWRDNFRKSTRRLTLL